ncbi:HAD family hydrolase, partial [bacterium]|nr:HAD family hydrolase [bacterium]
DESVLTGESEPMAKTSDPLAKAADAPYAAKNIGFTGTTVVSGRGVGVVIATGAKTQIGDIAKLTAQTDEPSAFEKSIGRFSVFILKLIVVTLIVVFVANVAIKGTGANVPELLVFAIALAVSVIPEALPVVITTTLSRGALRLAKRHVVVKRLSAIEDLGSIDVLCSDKTGTITENKMEVADVHGSRHHEALYLAAVASSFLGERRPHPNTAFDVAVWDKLDETDRKKAAETVRTDEKPFDPVRRYNSVVADGQTIVRGAPEEVVALCGGGADELAWASEQGTRGRRVLAVAAGKNETSLKIVGILSFVDPVKPTAAGAIRRAKALGVHVKILTGDSREVAASVARGIKLIASDDEVMTGAEWDAVPEHDRLAAAQAHAVFARVSPRQKFEIIESLRGCCEVGFLGEGINDAPALKVASVGIVVDGASDIAREAADIVLLQHSLDVIVEGIREGREVFANTVKYIKATLASNFGNFLAIATATFLVDYLPMLSIQILLLNLLSDFPMIAIATDRVDGTELKSPRTYDLRDIAYAATVLGVVSTVFDFIFFGLYHNSGASVLQTNWFVGSVLTELALIFSVRTRLPFWKAARPAGILLWLSVAAVLAAVAIPHSRFGHDVFHFVTPAPGTLAGIFGIVIVYFTLTEIVKLAYERFSRTLAKPVKGR